MPNKRVKKVKAWAVCFALNHKCMQGDLVVFTKRKHAQSYIKDLHQRIGGFENDHHVVPCAITYTLPKQKK